MNNQSINNILREAAVAYETTSSMSLVELARKGISKKSLLKLAEIGNLSLNQFSELLPVSLRTLQRYNDDDLLPSETSEHVLVIAEVFARGTEVFNDRSQLRRWLHMPCISLANETPISLLDTSFGARMVTEELGRLEQGVYA